MVQRMIGKRMGTGGSGGVAYLRSTVSERYQIFSDITNLAGYLVPRSLLPPLPSALRAHLALMYAHTSVAADPKA